MDGGLPPLSDAEFERFRELLASACGLALADGKKALVRGRVGRRLRALGLGSFGAYFRHLSEHGRSELPHLWAAVTTHETRFFREPHHFDALRAHVLPDLVARREPGQPLHFWSAACSTGQEAYSVASVALLAVRERPVDVLGTDIDRRGIEIARAGVYPPTARGEIPALHLLRHFEAGGGVLSAGAALRAAVRFRSQNLRELAPPGGRFDVVFCRNAMMYFHRQFRGELLQLFHRSLAPDGYLFLGTAEGMHGLQAPFRPERLGRALVFRPLAGGGR